MFDYNRDDDKKLKKQKIIFTVVSILYFLTGLTIAISVIGIEIKGDGFVVFLFIVLLFGGVGGLIAYLIYSLVVLWKCDELYISIKLRVVLNFILPFVYCGIMCLFRL